MSYQSYKRACLRRQRLASAGVLLLLCLSFFLLGLSAAARQEIRQPGPAHTLTYRQSTDTIKISPGTSRGIFYVP